MRSNPFPDEPTSAQPTDIMPKGERMADLPPKPPQSVQPQSSLPIADVVPEVESAEARQEEARTVRYAIGKLNDFLRWFVTVLEVTLAIRFLLKLIGADPANLFAGFLYSLTDIILIPFSNIVPSPSIHPPYQAFEWSTLIAMIIYALIVWAIRKFLSILITSPEEHS
jgi:hypothetical protein